MKKIFSNILLALFLSSCGTATFTMNQSQNGIISTEPTYEERKHYLLAGLIGTNVINVFEICGEQQVVQFETTKTPVDFLFEAATFQLYSPKTVRVWCQ
jgi:hypothetical protein